MPDEHHDEVTLTFIEPYTIDWGIALSTYHRIRSRLQTLPLEEPKVKSGFAKFVEKIERKPQIIARESLKTALKEKGRFAYNKKPTSTYKVVDYL